MIKKIDIELAKQIIGGGSLRYSNQQDCEKAEYRRCQQNRKDGSWGVGVPTK
jgi:hypothetical protein